MRQILLVDNFDEFRNLMVKRNKELERKALELMLKEEKRRLAASQKQGEEYYDDEEESGGESDDMDEATRLAIKLSQEQE